MLSLRCLNNILVGFSLLKNTISAYSFIYLVVHNLFIYKFDKRSAYYSKRIWNGSIIEPLLDSLVHHSKSSFLAPEELSQLFWFALSCYFLLLFLTPGCFPRILLCAFHLLEKLVPYKTIWKRSNHKSRK